MNPFNKSDKDPFDEAGLNFELNAAIESNPFQKKRNLLKEKNETTSTTQPSETTSQKTYTSSYQKPITGTTTSSLGGQSYGNKSSAFPESTSTYKNPTQGTTIPEKTTTTPVTGTTSFQRNPIQSQYSGNEPPKTYTTTSSTTLAQNQGTTVQQNTQIQPEKPSVGNVSTTSGSTYTRGTVPSFTSTQQVNKTEPPKMSATTFVPRSTVQEKQEITPPTKFTPTATTNPTTELPKTTGFQTESPPKQNQTTSQTTGALNVNSSSNTGLSGTGTGSTRSFIPQNIKAEPPKPNIQASQEKGLTQSDIVYKSPADKSRNYNSPVTATGVSSNQKEQMIPTQKAASDKTGSGYKQGGGLYSTPTSAGRGDLQKQVIIPTSKYPRNLLVSRNDNRGLMVINAKTNGNRTSDIQTNYLSGLKQDALSYPGPYRYDKKSLMEKRGELLRFIEVKLTESSPPFVYRISLMVLREYLNNNVSSLYRDVADKSREIISNELYHYVLDFALSNLTNEYREYFNFSVDFLINSENLTFQDANWEDVLFKSLFLRNTTFSVDPANIDFVLNYVRSKFAPGDPLHTVSMVKLGFLHEIFETPFFVENSFHHTWPLLIYPCLRFYNIIPPTYIEYFFNSLALKIVETESGTTNGILALLLVVLTGNFDGETVAKICRTSKNPFFSQVLESYYFVLKSNDNNFDKSYNLISKSLRVGLNYSYYLLDLGEYEKAKEYTDSIINTRPYFNELEHDNVYLRQIRVIRDLIINHYTILEESKSAANQGSFLASKKDEIKQSATQTIQKLQAKGKSLFGFVNNAKSAFSSFLNASETNPLADALAEKMQEERNQERNQEKSISSPTIIANPNPVTISTPITTTQQATTTSYVKPQPTNIIKAPQTNVVKPPQTNIVKPPQANIIKPVPEETNKESPPTIIPKTTITDDRPPISTQKFEPPKTTTTTTATSINTGGAGEEDPNKLNKAIMSNPFSGVQKPTTTTTTTTTAIKKIPQNRYISPF